MKNKEIFFFRIRDKCFAYSINNTQCVSIDNLTLSVLPRLLENKNEWIHKMYSPVFTDSELDSCINQCLEFLNEQKSYRKGDSYKYQINQDINNICLLLAYDCNLRCEYCYAHGGSFGEQRMLMSQNVMTKAIDFCLKNTGKEEKIQIGFFGGEPLLNFDVIVKCVTYANRRVSEINKEVTYSIVTNATLLNQEIMDFLYNNNFSIIFSIDGPKSIHDRHRKSMTGKSTHSLVLHNVLTFKKNYTDDFTIRGTFTSITPNFSEQVLFLNDLGFNQISVEEAQLSEKHPGSIYSQSDILRIQLEYDKLADIFLEWFDKGKHLHFYPFENCLRDIINPKTQHRPCGSGCNVIAIAPDGSIFPCFEAAIEKENIIGHIDKGFDDTKRLVFQSNYVDKYKLCQECWLKYFCGGGCYSFNIHYNRNIGIPYQPNCDLTKYRYMISAWIMSKIIERGEEAVMKLKSNLGI